MKLRPYQRQAVDSIGRCLADAGSTLMVLPTGTGKTVVFAHVIKEHCEGRALVLAHREELIVQNARTIERVVGEPCDIERAEQHADLGGPLQRKAKVIVASKDSLYERRLSRFDPSEFGLIVTDECFPRGTLVDRRSIETICVGDAVRSWSHDRERMELKKVTRTFKSKPAGLIRVMVGGVSIVCTPGHPFWTNRGYVPAVVLDCGDMVFRLRHEIPQYMHNLRAGFCGDVQPENLLKAVRNYSKETAQEADQIDVCCVQNAHYCQRSKRSGNLCKMSQGILLRSVQERVQKAREFRDDGANQQKIRVNALEGTKPDASTGDPQEGFGHHETTWSQASHTGWKWSRTDGSRTPACQCSRLVNQSHCSDKQTEDQSRTSAFTLQDRRGQSDLENRGGDRRRIAQGACASRPGSQEGCVLEIERVDSVQVLKPGRDGTFGGLCPDGFVYNIEVEENHNYFVENVLVHNCHHSTATTYGRVYD